MTGKRRVTVEVDPNCEPITGRLENEPEPSRPFTGWLELLAALEAALTEHDRQED
jgi:hypothetical protein